MPNPVFATSSTSIFEQISRLANEVGAINLGQGFPVGFEPPALIEAAVQALREGPHQYPPMMGLPALRQAVAANAKRFHGLNVDWEREVLVTSGATEALADSFLALLDTGDEVIVIEPAYDAYPTLIRRAGGTVVPLRLEAPDWTLTREALQAAITPRTKLIVLNTPMNPIGKIFSEAELDLLEEVVLAHDLVIVSDEVYEHLVFDGARHTTPFSRPAIRDRVVRIGSAGKTFSVTGWKVGYVTADPKLLGPISRAHQFVTFTTPPALQTAVAAGLHFADSYYVELKSSLETRRDLLLGALRREGFAVADAPATYFAIADVSGIDPDGDDLAFCHRITREAGVAAVPLSSFYGARDVKTHIRFCFAKPLDTLEDAVSRLSRWRETHGRKLAS
ncbi:aminotransferase [Mesorhizobium sp. RP14(2022)]|uniref:Aminotransferase n=1 Tax=Mesorhizobium liriopis TaxID=2953882 RepID=A0ABT1CAN3_9HYPH|nr:aminotransferase [Mesorhizobium liriopis]MCO6051862.1 aminotransferase [Mesorhizobium liriopis]